MTQPVGSPRVRVAMDVSILTGPLDFAWTFAAWFSLGYLGALVLGLVR